MSLDLDELERLAAAATPRPWRFSYSLGNEGYVVCGDIFIVAELLFPEPDGGYGHEQANAAFIAASRAAVPDLITALRASQAENARLREGLAFYADRENYIDHAPVDAATDGDGDVTVFDNGSRARAALTQGPVT
jgi:hypothetical protein